MNSNYVEYVPTNDVLANVAVKVSTLSNLRTSSAIILALPVVASYLLNIILFVTILTSRKLRTSSIYLMFCLLSTVNLLDLSFSILLSLLIVSNGGALIIEDQWCRVNATTQEFCQLYTLLWLMLMSVERAAGLVIDPPPALALNERLPEKPRLFNSNRVLVFSVLLGLASLCVAVPVSTGLIPVKLIESRYVCAVGSGAPLGYTLTRVTLYIGCLCVFLICVSVIFRKREGHPLPQLPHECSDFIRSTRTTQEHLSRAKLVTLLMSIFILVEGPHLSISFAYEICNSTDGVSTIDMFHIPQHVETLITWLKFLFPLLSPLTVRSYVGAQIYPTMPRSFSVVGLMTHFWLDNSLSDAKVCALLGEAMMIVLKASRNQIHQIGV